MFQLAWVSSKLILNGKLLRNPGYFYRQVGIGITIGLLLLLGIDKMGVNLIFALIVSSLALGITMPFLLKDVKL